MPKNNYVISREKAEVFDAMGIPYEGYVAGVGYQSLHAFALGSCYFQNSNYCIPHFQPVMDASPEEKIKSLRIDGDDLMDKLVKINTGGEPTINMGHGKYLKLSDNCEIVAKVDDGERFRFGYRDYTTGKEEIISGKLAEFEDVFGESELLFDCPCDEAGSRQGGFDLGDGLIVAGGANLVANGFYSSVARNSGNSTIGSNGYTYLAKSGQRGFYGNQYVTTKSLAGMGRATKFLGPVGYVISGGQIIYGVYQDGGTYGYNAQVATGSALGGFAGGLVGAKSGAAIGGAIGVWFGGVGAVPGAIIGGFVGGVVGGLAGSKAGEAAINYYY
jgi:hypothetical protein